MTELRDVERESIRAFVQSAADDGYFSGRVLDYGCGKQPYRDIVEAVGEYVGYDHESFPAKVGDFSVGTNPIHDERFDAILCTQVVQYVPLYPDTKYVPLFALDILLGQLHAALWSDDYGVEPGGHLVLTYPTNWPEVEAEDLHRFTKAGMERLLTEAGFEIVRHERRASVNLWVGHGCRDITEEIALGYGVIARA